jgi:hypothetical protein
MSALDGKFGTLKAFDTLAKFSVKKAFWHTKGIDKPARPLAPSFDGIETIVK